MKRAEIVTKSAEQTCEKGFELGKRAFSGLFIALIGELGAGKTVFVKGLAAGLGVEDASKVKSPSFVILHEYRGPITLYHMDAYRLSEESFYQTIDHREYFYSDGVTVLEWADRVPDILPARRLDIKIEHMREECHRRITAIPLGADESRLLEAF